MALKIGYHWHVQLLPRKIANIATTVKRAVTTPGAASCSLAMFAMYCFTARELPARLRGSQSLDIASASALKHAERFATTFFKTVFAFNRDGQVHPPRAAFVPPFTLHVMS